MSMGKKVKGKSVDARLNIKSFAQLEKEVQAQFLKPMAASLAFGILFATLITLILLPALYLIAKEIKDTIRNLYGIRHAD